MIRHHRRSLVAAVLLAGLAAVASTAPRTVAEAGGMTFHDYTDLATGMRCVNPTCDTVRLPNSDCICTKGNSVTNDARKVHLTCYRSERGRWVSCPIVPPY